MMPHGGPGGTPEQTRHQALGEANRLRTDPNLDCQLSKAGKPAEAFPLSSKAPPPATLSGTDRVRQGVLNAPQFRMAEQWAAWAEALWTEPSEFRSAAGAELWRRLGAWVVPPAPRRETPRRRLARLAVRLLRAGCSGRELLRQLDKAAATLPEPIAAEDVGSVALWAAQAVRETRHVSGR